MRALAIAQLLAALMVAVPGCAARQRSIDFQAIQPGPVSADGLRRVEGREVSAAFVHPDAFFGAYDEIAVDPLRISHKPEARPLDQASLERLQEIYADTLREQLARSDAFRLVSEPGPRTLRVSGRIVNVDVRIPRSRSGEKRFVLDSGEMTLLLDVRDSQTGRTLVRIADRRRVRPSGLSSTSNDHHSGYAGYEDTPVNVWGAVREIVDDWARIVRQGLDDLRTMAPVPIPDELGEG
ncbi:MAG: DUF3313 family protein [Myxococcota bacterium]